MTTPGRDPLGPIKRCPAGAAHDDQLANADQTVVREHWATQIERTRAGLHLQQDFTTAGRPCSRLDLDGRVNWSTPGNDPAR